MKIPENHRPWSIGFPRFWGTRLDLQRTNLWRYLNLGFTYRFLGCSLFEPVKQGQLVFRALGRSSVKVYLLQENCRSRSLLDWRGRQNKRDVCNLEYNPRFISLLTMYTVLLCARSNNKRG